jgi:hypothetical protein
MSFQTEAQGDDEGDDVNTIADDTAVHLGENADARLQADLQPGNAEGDNKNDDPEV